jgi:aminoacrylate hydrolase
MERQVDVGDTLIHVALHGEGEPVLLLTGFAGVGAAWGPQIARVASARQAIVPDHRGTGRSGRPDGGYSIERHAADMAAVLDALATGPAHVVGSSTGGAIALLVAARRPELVRSLTLASTFAATDAYVRRHFEARLALLDAGADELASARAAAIHMFSAQWIAAHDDAVETWCERAVATARDTGAAIIRRRIAMLLAHDARPELDAIDAPALVVAAEHDTCLPPYLSEAVAAGVPGAQLIRVEAGHLAHLEAPDAWWGAVEPFLAEHAA